jgi:hypothetical protein
MSTRIACAQHAFSCILQPFFIGGAIFDKQFAAFRLLQSSFWPQELAILRKLLGHNLSFIVHGPRS